MSVDIGGIVAGVLVATGVARRRRPEPSSKARKSDAASVILRMDVHVKWLTKREKET